MTLDLSHYRRIVVKIGSALLVDREAGLKKLWLNAVADDLAALRANGSDILVVSSGAIALGRTALGLSKRVLKLEESQAAAASGQMLLTRAWDEALSQHHIKTGQILLTLDDTEARRRYLNARATIETLLGLGAVPIINENDTVATSEIRYGDNDRLAARVATMMGADLLILLSDIDGLYTAPPARDPDARHLAQVDEITPEIEAMAGGAASVLSRGGMITKIEAGKIANAAGTAMIIANGHVHHPLKAIENGARHTFFKAKSETSGSAYKTWIAGHLEPEGFITVDEGAVRALGAGKSLLAAGVTDVKGAFSRGDMVAILSQDRQEIARGLIAYDAPEAIKIMGKRSDDIEALLGYPARAAMIHRDDLVMQKSSGIKDIKRALDHD